ncbi:hypothetical protein [Kineococcus rubinsiae]|uniref:hypothetical protein n=1 Tax=Kineococcus rubinsiae TaxID=2609562 RepID=UPI001430A53C|nr:hypothetical protein [Kineococcus rubinsiae]NIZ91395.1 hypothetical protein [Kineococcus rubinsiae]
MNPGAGSPAGDAWGDGEPEPRILTAGDWSLVLRGTSVEEVSHRGTLVLTAVRVVVRDHDWRTVPVTSWAVEVHEGEGLRVELTAEHDALGAGVRWHAVLTAGSTDGAGHLRVEVSGEVTRAFRRNRLGLVVLHPAALAGTPLRVRHPDGSRTGAEFPARIAPHQPARDVAGLDWDTGGPAAQRVTLDLTGDVFEVEDQRNWTDASFKTYSTPLDRPFPVDLAVGATFTQALDLAVVPLTAATAPRVVPAPVEQVDLTPTGQPLPRLQLAASTAPGDGPGGELRLGWWRGPVLVELDATGPAWPGVLARARREAGAAGLDVRVTAAHPGQLDPVLAALHEEGPVVRVAVHDVATHVTTAPLWERLLRLRGDLPVAGGTRAHFTELNRRHGELPGDVPALVFSSTPQMHDTGRPQLLASVAVQRLTAEEAVRIAAGRPVHVGPVTLRARFNAVATSAHRPADADVRTDGTGPQHVWGADDPRQAGRGAAAWLLAAHQAFAVAGVASITACETWGPRGTTTADGVALPVAEVVGWLQDFDGWERLDAPLTPGLGVVAARSAGRLTVLAADLTGVARRLRVAGRELALPAWGVVRLEGPGPSAGGATAAASDRAPDAAAVG